MITKKIIEAIEQKEYIDDIENQCALCGIKKSFKFTERKKILSASFTDFNNLKIKNSKYICGYCEKLVSSNYMPSPSGKTCGITLYSFLVENNTFKTINYPEKMNYLMFYEYNLPAIICFTDMGKKHISWKAKETTSNNEIIINTETSFVVFNREKNKEVYNLIIKLYENKITKAELLECNIQTKKLNKLISEKVITFSDLIFLKKHKNSNDYNLIVNCLTKKQQENNDD